MRTGRQIRRRLRASAGPLCGLLAGAYFVFHAINGGNGLLAMWRHEAALSRAVAVHARLADESGRLEHRISLLRSSRLDRDFLEERARRMSGMARAGDIIIYTGEPEGDLK
ncbi:MAG: FtsB family cell division protein [Rhodospirillales bacterium]